jgi:hypothetical protein
VSADDYDEVVTVEKLVLDLCPMDEVAVAVVVAAAEIAVADHEIVVDELEASAVDHYYDIASSSSADDGYFDYDYDIHSIDFDFALKYHYYSPKLSAEID